MAQYGWAAVVLAAIFATAALSVFALACLAFWRYLHPLPILAASPESGAHGFPSISTETNAQVARDLLLLLMFSVDYTTVLFLDGLDESLSAIQSCDPLKSNPTRHSEEVAFLRRVGGALAGTHREYDFASIMQDAKNDAEAEVRRLPQGDLPPGLNLFEVREWAISQGQSNRVLVYLLGQKHEVEGRLRSQRSGLLERLALRKPS